MIALENCVPHFNVVILKGTEPDVTSEEIPLPSEEPEKYENARRQRKRATVRTEWPSVGVVLRVRFVMQMTETTGEDSGDQQDGKEKEVMRDEVGQQVYMVSSSTP